MSEGCVFCDQSWMRAAEIFIETSRCIDSMTSRCLTLAALGDQRPGKQTARPMGARERTGTSGSPIVLLGDDPDQRSYG
jgi:hypothetical protein